MIRVSEVVEELLKASQTASEAMQLGILNLSAYANQIHDEVEAKTLKPVQHGTIIVALSRLAKRYPNGHPLKPNVTLEELSIKAPLCDITFESTTDNLRLTKSLSNLLPDTHAYFFTVTQGINEITIVASETFKGKILKHFPVKPKSQFYNLVGITVRFGEEYLPQPNVIFAILYALAIKRINLVEIISTYTELTMVIEEENVDVALAELNRLFRKS